MNNKKRTWKSQVLLIMHYEVRFFVTPFLRMTANAELCVILRLSK